MKVNILLVDDEERVRTAYRDLPTQYPSIENVWTAATEDEYWDLLAQHRDRVSVVVVDLLLDARVPIELSGQIARKQLKFSGFDLIRRTLEVYPGQSIAVLSQFTHETTVLSVYRLGARCFLAKHEVTTDELVSHLIEVAAGQVVIPNSLPLSARNRIAAHLHETLDYLTDEEISVVEMLLNGYSTEEIRQATNSISRAATNNKISGILGKSGCSNRKALCELALQAGMVPDNGER